METFKFTIREICELLGVAIPQSLIGYEKQEVNGIEARYSQLTKQDIYFDIDPDEESFAKADEIQCYFIVTAKKFNLNSTKTTIVRVEDPLEKYVELCQLLVNKFSKLTRIAIGGSSGKTSMKEMVSFVLGQIASTKKSFANSNNILGLLKQMGTIKENNRFYVQEIGLKSDGNAKYTVKMAEAFSPNIAVLTNIGDNHKEAYGTKENIFYYKKSIVDFLVDDGIALLNKDDEYLRDYHPNADSMYYSIKDSSADVYADNILFENGRTIFDIIYKGELIKDIELQSLGVPNIYNALVTFAIAKLCNIDNESIIRALKKFKLEYATRCNYTNIAGYPMLIDCFNSSPESVKFDLDIIDNVDLCADNKKVVVLGDIVELGEDSELLHRQLGGFLKDSSVDVLFLFGELTKYIYEEVNEGKPQVFYTTNRKELENAIASMVKVGDLILWKASHSMHLELSIDNLWGTDLYALYPEDESEKLVHSTKLYEYSIYQTGLKLLNCKIKSNNVRLPLTINSEPIKKIASKAFMKKSIVRIKIPEYVESIGNNAFFSCLNLISIDLSKKLKYISRSAFNTCIALTNIYIPKSCRHIGYRAFRNCKRLESIYIPNPETYIEDEAFDLCPNLVIYCAPQSFAEKYAKDHHIQYSYLSNGEISSVIHVPDRVLRDILIKNIYLETYDDKTRINFDIIIDHNRPDTLWWEVDNRWEDYICADRCDAAVVVLLLYAMHCNYDRIISEYPISEKLWYQLSYHLIPQICKVEGIKVSQVQIVAPKTNLVYQKEKCANGTGFSRGVDSFATLYEYGHNSNCLDDYKVTHLVMYNVGAFHGKDVGLRSGYSSKQLYQGHLKESQTFAKNNHYDFFKVDSNMTLFLDDNFGHWYFQNTATQRNIGTTLLFQKLFEKFYYSSGHTMDEFKLSLDGSSALWEHYGVQFFNTENTQFYITNRAWNRLEKTEKIAELPETYNSLQVCLVEIGNCGICTKCKRTLMGLDVLGNGLLDKYSASFDIQTYKERYREQWFGKIWLEKEQDEYIMEVFKYGIEHHSALIPPPVVKKFDKLRLVNLKRMNIIVRELPTVLSDEIAFVTKAECNLKAIGIVGSTWVKVRLLDGKEGFVSLNSVNIEGMTKQKKSAQKSKSIVKRVYRSFRRRLHKS